MVQDVIILWKVALQGGFSRNHISSGKKLQKYVVICIMSCAKVQTEMLSIHLLPKLIFLSLHFLSLLTVATQGICVLQHKSKNYTEPPLWVWLWQGNGSDGWDVAHKTQMRPFTESISAYKWIASIMTTYLFTTWLLLSI